MAKEDDKVTPEDIGAITKQLGVINDQVKTVAEDVKKKMEAGVTVTTELKEKADAALLEQAKLREQVEKLGGIPDKLKEIGDRTTEMEQKMARRPSGNGPVDAEKTPGEMFIGDDKFKAVQQSGSQFRGRCRVSMKSITSAGFSVEVMRVPGIVPQAERRMTVRDLLTPGRTSSNSIQYVRETGFTNSAAAVAEAATKPESNLTYELVTRSVATIAHWILASKQILDDAPMLQTSIDGRLRFGLAYVEEDQLLNGDGTGANLHGIIPQAADFAPAFVPTSPQRIDTIRLALLQSELAEFPATGVVMHPTAWARIELTKDGDNRYIFTQPQNETQPRLWGRPVVATQAMDLTEFLTGAFKLGAQIFDREDANVEISTEDSDNFRRNLVSIRAEERLALAVYRGESFTHGDFGDAS